MLDTQTGQELELYEVASEGQLLFSLTDFMAHVAGLCIPAVVSLRVAEDSTLLKLASLNKSFPPQCPSLPQCLLDCLLKLNQVTLMTAFVHLGLAHDIKPPELSTARHKLSSWREPEKLRSLVAVSNPQLFYFHPSKHHIFYFLHYFPRQDCSRA